MIGKEFTEKEWAEASTAIIHAERTKQRTTPEIEQLIMKDQTLSYRYTRALLVAERNPK